MKKRVMKTQHFSRWVRKAGLTDETLCNVIGEMETDAVGVSLGGGVYKKRVALSGRGKRDENIKPSLLPELKKCAKTVLAQPPSMLKAMLATEELKSVKYG